TPATVQPQAAKPKKKPKRLSAAATTKLLAVLGAEFRKFHQDSEAADRSALDNARQAGIRMLRAKKLFSGRGTPQGTFGASRKQNGGGLKPRTIQNYQNLATYWKRVIAPAFVNTPNLNLTKEGAYKLIKKWRDKQKQRVDDTAEFLEALEAVKP